MKKVIYQAIANPLFSGSAMMIIGSNGASAINSLYHLVTGRLLGPALYGELASLISVIGLLSIIPTALSLVIVKQISSAKDEAEISYLINWFKTKMVKFSVIFSIAIILLSPLISSFLNIQKISYLILIGLSFLFSLQSVFNRSILQGLLRFREIVVSILAENTTKLVISIILIILGFEVLGAMISFVVASLLGFYLTNSFLKTRKGEYKEKNINLKPMFFLIFPVLIQSISTTSIYSSDVILVKHFFSSYEAGIYAALSTLGKIIFFGAGPITAVMFPLVAKRNSRGEDYKRVLIYSFVATVFFSSAVCLFYWIAPRFAINLLFGSLYVESAHLLIWFGIFMSLFTLSFLLINFGISLGKNKITIFPLVFAILQVVLIYLFHQTLFIVVLISLGVNALLLITLLIYLNFGRGFQDGKDSTRSNKISFHNSSGI